MVPILIVDDDPGFQKLLETILRGEGYQVHTAANLAEARACASRHEFHLVLCDLKLPDGSGLEMLRWLKESSPEIPVLIITGFGTVASAVEAMKLGAADYLGKPLSSPEELRLLVRRTLAARRRDSERVVLREEESRRFDLPGIVAVDQRLLQALELARKVAPTNATVLLTGESGTGKEVVARAIHRASLRAQSAFVPVNCAALAPSLIESELFGHEKGSFTGAMHQHLGRFERAHGGTLFLDEIAELDANLQVKLLRVLQERTFERVGGSRQIVVDLRVIAATNRDLLPLVGDGRFRADLFYRLGQFPIHVPPLRERVADIRPLARFFLERSTRNLKRPPLALTAAAEDALAAYAWPGNVRELENMMERVAILCETRVDVPDLPLPAPVPRPVLVKDFERQAIEESLARHEGNRTHAARELGISLRTLQYRLKKYGLTR
jgi:DNA-binding NtrC family response regulator